MTRNEYDKLARVHGLSKRSADACRRVLVDGETAYHVAKTMGMEQSTISRALGKLARPVCGRCGQPIG